VHPASVLLLLFYAFGLRLASLTWDQPAWRPVQTRETLEDKVQTRETLEDKPDAEPVFDIEHTDEHHQHHEDRCREQHAEHTGQHCHHHSRRALDSFICES